MIIEQQLVDAGYSTTIYNNEIWYIYDAIRGKAFYEDVLLCPYCGSPDSQHPPTRSYPHPYICLIYECGVIAAHGVHGIIMISERTASCTYIGSSHEEDDVI